MTAVIFVLLRLLFSGRVGTSGLCMFSKYRIVDTFFHPYMLNGYWYQFFHGDSHVQKGVAYARVLVNDIVVNCFMTHVRYFSCNF